MILSRSMESIVVVEEFPSILLICSSGRTECTVKLLRRKWKGRAAFSSKCVVVIQYVSASKLCSYYWVLYRCRLETWKIKERIQSQQWAYCFLQEVQWDLEYSYWPKIWKVQKALQTAKLSSYTVYVVSQNSQNGFCSRIPKVEYRSWYEKQAYCIVQLVE